MGPPSNRKRKRELRLRQVGTVGRRPSWSSGLEESTSVPGFPASAVRSTCLRCKPPSLSEFVMVAPADGDGNQRPPRLGLTTMRPLSHPRLRLVHFGGSPAPRLCVLCQRLREQPVCWSRDSGIMERRKLVTAEVSGFCSDVTQVPSTQRFLEQSELWPRTVSR